MLPLAGCPSGGLDMSKALFDYFASESVGVFYMEVSLRGRIENAA